MPIAQNDINIVDESTDVLLLNIQPDIKKAFFIADYVSGDSLSSVHACILACFVV